MSNHLLRSVAFVVLLSGLCFAEISTVVPEELPTTHSATLAWDPVTDSFLSGYRLLVGTSSGHYTETHDVGLTSQFTLSGLEYGLTYFAVVISHSQDGLQSEPSTELSFTVLRPSLPSNPEVAVDAYGKFALKWTYSKADAALGSSPEFVIQASPDLTNWTEVETISASEPAAEDGELLKFVRPLAITGTQMFYRLTAKNWVGESTGP